MIAKSENDENFLQTLGVSSEHIITAEDESLINVIKQLNHGRGVDVVFSCGSVDAHISRECWRSLAPYGRYIEFGRKNALQRRFLDVLPLNQGANVFFFDLLDMYKLKPHVLTRYDTTGFYFFFFFFQEKLTAPFRLLNRTMKLYNDGSIHAIQPTRIVKISDLDNAVQDFSDKFAAGKVVISYEAGTSRINVFGHLKNIPFPS